jgi:hypothetical protein
MRQIAAAAAYASFYFCCCCCAVCSLTQSLHVGLGVFLLLQLLPNTKKSTAAVAADIRLFCSSNSCNTQTYKRKS